MIDRDSFVGDKIEILIEKDWEFTAKPHYEDADIPRPSDFEFDKQLIPLREVIVNNGLTKQAMDRATGGAASWGRIVDRVLQRGLIDLDWLMNISLIGNGSGALARVVSAVHAAGVVTVTCDNTYTDFGWENVALLKKGMRVEIYNAAGDTLRTVSGGVVISGTPVFGDRNNGAPAGVTGTFTFAAAVDPGLADNDVVYIYDAKTSALTQPLPQGLLAFVQGNGDDYAGAAALTTFQNLTRASYACLKGRVYQASDFASGGVDGTPDDWDLSVISDATKDVKRGGSKGDTDLILCSEELATAIGRKNRAEAGITVQAGATTNLNQVAVGGQYAKFFIRPSDDRPIPIRVAETIPENCLYGLALESSGMRWHPFGDIDYMRLTGDIWMKSPDDRKANFEAPRGGYYQISTGRNDPLFCIQDLRTDV